MKTRLLILCTALITLFLVWSCERATDSSKQSADKQVNSLFTAKESSLLQKKYGFSTISSYSDYSKNQDFRRINNSSKLKFKLLDDEELDLTKVTVLKIENIGSTYIISFKQNSKKFLLISTKKGGKTNINNGTVIENLVDRKGNGAIIFTNIDGKNIDEIKNGSRITSSNIAGKSPFRVCLDKAYDDVCDGFLGCVAWYSNPGVALAACAFCELTT